jgi:hypothetical protein
MCSSVPPRKYTHRQDRQIHRVLYPQFTLSHFILSYLNPKYSNHIRKCRNARLIRVHVHNPYLYLSSITLATFTRLRCTQELESL